MATDYDTTTGYSIYDELVTVIPSDGPEGTAINKEVEVCVISDGLKLYVSIEWYLYYVLGICGIITNLLNIYIFTRPAMRKSPTNRIFTALAIGDLLFCLRLLLRTALDPIYDGKFFFYAANPRYKSKWQAYMGMIDASLFMFFHTWVIYLTLLVAIWRLIGIRYPLQSLQWLSLQRVMWTIYGTFVWSALLVPPLQLGMTLKDSSNLTGIRWNETRLTREDFKEYPFLWEYNSYSRTSIPALIYTLLIKLGPVFLLSIITALMITFLSESTRHRQRLSELNKPPTVPAKISSTGTTAKEENGQKMVRSNENQTNRMLVVVLIIFILTEGPTGIFGIIWAIKKSVAFGLCSGYIVRRVLIVEGLSSMTSFFVYFTMSRNFRQIFLTKFRPFVNQKLGVSSEGSATKVTTMVHTNVSGMTGKCEGVNESTNQDCSV